MICNPKSENIEQIKEIWSLCFGDGEETVDFFFNTCFSAENCYVYIKDGRAVASLQMIPCRISVKDSFYTAKYMYAVCTHPLFQGKGIMSELISTALEQEKQKGTKAVLCIPASASLFGFYKKFGFTDKIYSSVSSFTRDEIRHITKECRYTLNNDVSCLNNKRNDILRSKSFVSFSDEYMNLCNGLGYSFAFNDNFYAVFSEDGEFLKVSDCGWIDELGKKELLFCITNETEINRFIIEHNGKNNEALKGVVRCLDDMLELPEKLYFGIKME